MRRVFVALELPEIIRDALTQLQSGVDGARWRPEESLHLTLQFIGDVDRHLLRDVSDALNSLRAPSFSLTLSGCGFFGDKQPRSLWAGVEASSSLVGLQEKIETALRRAGAPIETRKFRPHVTLAYVKGVTSDQAAQYCTMHGLFSCGPFPVAEFHLFESFLGGETPYYEILESYSLSFSR